MRQREKSINAYLILSLTSFLYLLIFFIRQGGHSVYGTLEIQMQRSYLWTLIFILLLFLYFWGYRHVKHFSLKLIIGGYLTFAFILMMTPVLSSLDVYMYAMRGRVVSVYHQNPYLHSTDEFSHDPFLKLTCPAWRRLKQNYGPLWTIFSSSLAWMGHNRINLTLFLYKLWGFLGNSLVLFLVYKISRLWGSAKVKRRLFLYAWNPFLLIEFVNNAQNDIWMIFFGALALYFYYRKSDLWIVPSLVLAGLVKYIYWALIPLFLVFLWREKRLSLRVLLVSGTISLVALISFYLPFWRGLGTFSGLIEQSGIERLHTQYTPLVFFAFLSFNIFSASFFVKYFILKSILWLGRLIFLPIYIRTTFFHKKLLDAIMLILIFFAFLVGGTVLPWYISWWMFLLVLKKDWSSCLFWSTVGLAAYIFSYSVSLSLVFLGGIYLIFLWGLSIIKSRNFKTLLNYVQKL